MSIREMLIVFLCKSSCDKQVTRDASLNTYLKSPEFKVSFVTYNLHLSNWLSQEHVVGRLKSMLLDAKLSSYKTGVMDRVQVSFSSHDMCAHPDALVSLQLHMRLHPSQYKIPPEMRDSISSKLFLAAVSGALTSARSIIKQKVCYLWKYTPSYTHHDRS